MLNDIQKAEVEAKEILEKARERAEEIVKTSREEAVRIMQEAENHVRELKSTRVNESAETGAREAEKILTAAKGEIAGKESMSDALVKKTTDAVMKQIAETL